MQKGWLKSVLNKLTQNDDFVTVGMLTETTHHDGTDVKDYLNFTFRENKNGNRRLEMDSSNEKENLKRSYCYNKYALPWLKGMIELDEIPGAQAAEYAYEKLGFTNQGSVTIKDSFDHKPHTVEYNLYENKDHTARRYTRTVTAGHHKDAHNPAVNEQCKKWINGMIGLRQIRNFKYNDTLPKEPTAPSKLKTHVTEKSGKVISADFSKPH